MKIREIINAIEAFAPPSLQEGYDNTGYQTGNPDAEASGALLCIDVTEGIIDEAVAKGCNLVITHHPLLFRGVKCVIGRDRPERVLAKAIRNDITVYSSHTAMDSAVGGVSWRMAGKLGLTDTEVLVPSSPGAATGLGIVGNLEAPLSPLQLAERVKQAFSSQVLRISRPAGQLEITRVALCGRGIHPTGHCLRGTGIHHGRLQTQPVSRPDRPHHADGCRPFRNRGMHKGDFFRYFNGKIS